MTHAQMKHLFDEWEQARATLRNATQHHHNAEQAMNRAQHHLALTREDMRKALASHIGGLAAGVDPRGDE